MTFLLGLTGGIASGKSTVSNYFKAKNIPVVDADQVAHAVMEVGQPTVAAIKNTFGAEVFMPTGEIDRSELGRIVFDDAEKRQQLNEIVHPAIMEKLKKDTQQLILEKHPLIVLDIPLLYEGNLQLAMDQVMVIYVDVATQIERLLKRNGELTREDALNRINAQMSMEEKRELADIRVDNRGTIKQTYKQLDAWLDLNFPELA